MSHSHNANHFRIAHNSVHHRRAGDPSTCKTTSGFITAPAAGASIPATSGLNITWNTACMSSTTAVDIFLYAPATTSSSATNATASPTGGAIQTWANVDYAVGSYNATLNAAWWNHTSSVALQLAIGASGDPQWMATSENPASAIFTVTVDASSGSPSSSAADASGSSGGIQDVNSAPGTATGAALQTHPSALSRGALAAAVIMPLLLLVGLGAFAFIKYQRRQQAKKSVAFTEKVDRRMSVVAESWNPMSNAGFTAWRSSFWGGDGANAGGVIGEGAIGGDSEKQMMESHPATPLSGATPTTPGARPRPRPRNGSTANNSQTRVSRVSFASTGSTESGRARRSAIFIQAGENLEDMIPAVPPLPSPYQRQSDFQSHFRFTSGIGFSSFSSPSHGGGSGSDGGMTPDQAWGPEEFTVDDITARLSAAQDGDGEGGEGASDEDLSPALRMMLHDQFTRMQDEEDERRGAMEAAERMFYEQRQHQQHEFAGEEEAEEDEGQEVEIDLGTASIETPTPTATQRMNFPIPPTPSYTSTVRTSRRSPPSSFIAPSSPPARSASPPTAISPSHSGSGSGSVSAIPAVQMSPDEMLRAYSQRQSQQVHVQRRTSKRSSVAHGFTGAIPVPPAAAAQAFPPLPMMSGGRSLYNPATLPSSASPIEEEEDAGEAYAQ